MPKRPPISHKIRLKRLNINEVMNQTIELNEPPSNFLLYSDSGDDQRPLIRSNAQTPFPSISADSERDQRFTSYIEEKLTKLFSDQKELVCSWSLKAASNKLPSYLQIPVNNFWLVNKVQAPGPQTEGSQEFFQGSVFDFGFGFVLQSASKDDPNRVIYIAIEKYKLQLKLPCIVFGSATILNDSIPIRKAILRAIQACALFSVLPSFFLGDDYLKAGSDLEKLRGRELYHKYALVVSGSGVREGLTNFNAMYKNMVARQEVRLCLEKLADLSEITCEGNMNVDGIDGQLETRTEEGFRVQHIAFDIARVEKNNQPNAPKALEQISFVNINNRLRALEDQTVTIKNDFNTIKNDCSTIKNDFSTIKNDVSEIKNQMAVISTKLDSNQSQLITLIESLKRALSTMPENARLTPTYLSNVIEEHSDKSAA